MAKFAPALTSLVLIHQGKTRDTFLTSSPNELLIVATQRLSTHNIIHESEVPYKDQVLTALTVFWIKHLFEKAGIRHHLVACGLEIYDHLPGKQSDYPDDLHHRAIVVKELNMIPVEFIFRGYLVGSLEKNYYRKGLVNPYGIPLGPGLQVMSPFQDPLFTPTDKSETDEPLNSEATQQEHSTATRIATTVFTMTRDYLRSKGLELVDSKMELGCDEHSNVYVADEIVTPDSSRFCECSKIELGQEPPWLDKQIARDEAEKIWGKGAKGPLKFSDEIVSSLSKTYLDIFERITGSSLSQFQRDYLS